MTPTLIIITLILFGVLALLAEFLLIPGLGVAGILGLGSLIYSCVYAFQNFGTDVGTIVTAINIIIVIITLVLMFKPKTWKRLKLNEEIEAKTNQNSLKVQVGECGTTLTRLAPVGTCRFSTATCEVRSSDGTMIDPGTDVEVDFIEDNQIYVKPIIK